VLRLYTEALVQAKANLRRVGSVAAAAGSVTQRMVDDLVLEPYRRKGQHKGKGIMM
jgi:hypothetical protein